MIPRIAYVCLPYIIYGGIYLDMDMEIVKAFDHEQFTNGVTWGLDEGGDIEAADDSHQYG